MAPEVTVSEQTYRRLVHFKQVVEAIIEETMQFNECVELVLDQSLDGMLEDPMGPQGKETLVKSLQRLAERYPEQVYEFIADILRLGEASTREAAKRKLGYPTPEQKTRQ